MGNLFNNIGDAVTWLYVHGWRQNESGVWSKGNRRADINASPANDGVVAVVFRWWRQS